MSEICDQAPLIALGVCVCVVQERSVFRRIVLKNAYMRRKMFEELLESVPLLKSLSVRARSASFHTLISVKKGIAKFVLLNRHFSRHTFEEVSK